MTVYVDLLFALNLAINYLLLRGSAAIGGVCTVFWRLLAAAALGGVYAVAAVLPGLGFLQGWLFQALCVGLMLPVAFGLKRNTIKQGLFFLALSFAFGGVVLLVVQAAEPDCVMLKGRAYYAVSMPAMLLLAGVCYFIAGAILKGCGTHTGGDIIPVKLLLEGRELELYALRDTGNTLRDPMTGQTVMVVDGQQLLRLFPAVSLGQEAFTDPPQAMQELAQWYPGCRFCLLSYRAVGVEAGLLLAVRCRGKFGKKTVPLLAAFGPRQLGERFNALWGGAIT